MTTSPRLVIGCPRLVTCDETRASAQNPLGAIDDAALLIEGDRILMVGKRTEVLGHEPHARQINVEGVVTPGLVDAHTHLAWVGSRHDEYVMRMQGAGYEAIAAAGGGIVSSMRAVREASVEQLEKLMRRRLLRMAQLGTTTCEIKSGYGLDLEHETKQLRAIDAVSHNAALPRVVPTFLALHALPPEARAHRQQWIERVAKEWVPAVAQQKLARFIDAYIDRNAFSADEARVVFESAKATGMGVRAHVGQFADVGGADLAAELAAASVDHMENVSEEALAKLAASHTRAVLLPTASFTLRQTPPPVAAVRRAGVSMVVASDANPGTAPTESLLLAMAFALHSYGMTPEECILGATREAAASLGLGDVCGKLAPGYSADVVGWDLPHERALLQPWGSAPTTLVVLRGNVVHQLA